MSMVSLSNSGAPSPGGEVRPIFQPISRSIAQSPWPILPSADVIATVAIALVPQIPLAELRDALVPVEADGQLVDWLITMPSSPGMDTLAKYWAWSSSWASFWPVGPIANIAALVERIRGGRLPLAPELFRLLVRLTSADDDIAVDQIEADAIAIELGALQKSLAHSAETGFGLIDDMPTPGRTVGIARAWAPPRGDVVLAATESTAVILRESVGLVVRHGTARWQAFERLSAVDLRSDPALLVDDRGRELELSPAEARPLAWLLPRSLMWHVESISLTDVWGPLLNGLPAAIDAARNTGRPLRFTTRSRVIGPG